MSIQYGLTDVGFVSKPATVIKNDFDTAYKAVYGAFVGSNPDGSIPAGTLMGQEVAILTEAISSQWDLAQAVVSGYDVNQAVAFAQDNLCAITGTIREPLEFSSVTATLTGVSGTVIPAGSVATVTGALTRFDTSAVVVLGTVSTAWAANHAYNVGDFVTNSSKAYRCAVAGESANSGGPTGSTPNTPITDMGVTWYYIGAATVGVADVVMIAEVPGALACDALALVNIATPVAGWASVNNYAAGALGALQESSTALRARQQVELASTGNATADAIRAHVLAVGSTSTVAGERVTACIVFVNDTDATNADGLPPHSFEVVALGGTDQAIGNAIFASGGAGIYTYGTTSVTVTDSQGNTHTVWFTRPTPVPIYIAATVYYDPTLWPSTNTAALVQQTAISALLTFADSYYQIGFNVRSSPLVSAIWDGPAATNSAGVAIYPAPAGSLPMPGVVDVLPLYIGTTFPASSSAAITIGSREIATFSAANITITATSETP